MFSHQKKGLLTFLLLMAFFTLIISSKNVTHEKKPTQSSNMSNGQFSKNLQRVSSISSTLYRSHNPINIFGDVNFYDIASIEGWSGDGSPSDPYIIEEYNITSSSCDLIVIHDTTLHFIIRNNLINGLSESWGIVFYSVINGIVDSNTVKNTGMLGIGVYFSNNITITDNKVDYTTLNGIRIEDCPGPVSICNNTISHSTEAGIWVGDSSIKTEIKNNTIWENRCAITFGRDTNEYQGVFSSVISNNLIYNQTLYGIELSYSYNNLINYNFISDTLGYRIFLHYPCDYTEIKGNKLFNNNLGGISQARDDGSTNTFQFNFWSDHLAPDSNNDGIVDTSYVIAGLAGNIDPFPLIQPSYRLPLLTTPINFLGGIIVLIVITFLLLISLRKNR